MAPVDLAIANWRGFVAARQSWQRLSKLLAHMPRQGDPMPLKPPTRSLVVQNAAVPPPGQQKIVCQDVNFTGDVKLTPGMPVEAFIETGERTMLSYLVKPLRDQLMRAFREK